MQILQTLIGYFGDLVLLASALSAMVPKNSAIAGWLAWFGSMPIRHLPTKKVESKP